MIDVAKEFKGHADIVHSPDDGGFYADLLWDRKADCPIFDTPADAMTWAREHGAIHFHSNL